MAEGKNLLASRLPGQSGSIDWTGAAAQKGRLVLKPGVHAVDMGVDESMQQNWRVQVRVMQERTGGSVLEQLGGSSSL